MGRVYTVSGSNITIAGSGTRTLVFINPDVDRGIEILRAWCRQKVSTATNENLAVQLSTQVTAFPTLVSATPAAHAPADGASTIIGGTAGAAGTAGINASAEGAGGKTVLVPDVFNNIEGYIWVPTPEMYIRLAPSAAAGFGLVLMDAPAALTGWYFGVTYAETG